MNLSTAQILGKPLAQRILQYVLTDLNDFFGTPKMIHETLLKQFSTQYNQYYSAPKQARRQDDKDKGPNGGAIESPGEDPSGQAKSVPVSTPELSCLSTHTHQHIIPSLSLTDGLHTLKVVTGEAQTFSRTTHVLLTLKES